MITDRIPAIQEALAEASLDGWLFACFQHSDPVSLAMLGLDREGLLVTRRCYYLVPQRGEPKKLVHKLEPTMLDHLPGAKSCYLTWREHRQELAALVAGVGRLAAQYSPMNALPTLSRLDAGTAELLRDAGVTLASSGDLVQRFAAAWSVEQLEGHRRSCRHLHEIAQEAFRHVGDALTAGRPIDEHDAQRFVREAIDRRGMTAMSDPIVGVNANSADPHYQPTAERSAPIQRGDFLLIDLWGKEKTPGSVYADITWCGVCAPSPTERHQEVFSIVARARDAALERVTSRYPRETVCGYEVDDAARSVIEEAGYGERFIHRTGHSIDTEDHGQGANMDNLETHDTRRLLPMTGFSIEPGIYLTGDFGVRSEINVALTPERAEVTGGEPQRELVRLLV